MEVTEYNKSFGDRMEKTANGAEFSQPLSGLRMARAFGRRAARTGQQKEAGQVRTGGAGCRDGSRQKRNWPTQA